uniref:Uncharacterized protein n=1 Tax=Nelumbo nucifera TaxID=4432 RepID=A0A822YJ25_NELNU|nr:TPA_asm: hypothetical protein HUJ06_009777 [Nelumbo nucifera]
MIETTMSNWQPTTNFGYTNSINPITMKKCHQGDKIKSIYQTIQMPTHKKPVWSRNIEIASSQRKSLGEIRSIHYLPETSKVIHDNINSKKLKITRKNEYACFTALRT